MDFNSLEMYDWIGKLKCSECENLLSHFPIHISSNKENICGRCIDSSEEGYIRNEVYEIVAQEIPFPCRYKDEGCCEKLVPKYIPNHEENCPYKTNICVTWSFTKCTTQVSYLNIREHCQKQHSSLFLKDGKFEVRLSEGNRSYHLLDHDDQFLLVTKRFQVKSKILELSVTRKENESTYVVSPYLLTFTCGDRVLKIKCSVNAETYQNKISMDSLIDTKNQPEKISGRILIGAEAEPVDEGNVTEELLNVFKCSNCSEYAQPPLNIFSNTNSCPKCKTYPACYSASIMNSKMDKLVKLLNYPCENAKNGCDFKSKPHLLTTHQKVCKFEVQECPIKEYGTNCNWRNLGQKLEAHLLADHRNQVVNESLISENFSRLLNRSSGFGSYDPNYSNPDYLRFTKCYIFKFSNYIFNLIFLQKGQKYYWIVQMIGKFVNLFRYEIEIVSTNEKTQKMIMSQSCSKYCKKQDLLNNLNNQCCLHHDQIQNFLHGNTISFKVRIFKHRQNEIYTYYLE